MRRIAIWLHLAYFARLEAYFRCRARGGLLGVWVTPAAPRHERAADGEERRRVLDHDLERREGACGDEIECRKPFGPGLHACMDDTCIGELAGHDRALEERAFPGGALDERDGRPGKRDRERQPRKAGARAEVGDVLCHRHLRELERHQRVRQVVVDHLRRIAHRGRSQRIFDEQAMQPPQPARGVVR